MRTLALLLLAACADASPGQVDYARLAGLVGESIATPDAGGEVGALADAVTLARGGLPDGFSRAGDIVTGDHDGVRYTYVVTCEDAHGARTPCSPVAFRAVALAVWPGRSGTWTLEHLQGATASATGASELDHEDYATLDQRQEAFLLDLDSLRPAHGTVALDLVADDIPVTGAVYLDGSDQALITLDGNTFVVDLATGEVTPGGILRSPP